MSAASRARTGADGSRAVEARSGLADKPARNQARRSAGKSAGTSAGTSAGHQTGNQAGNQAGNQVGNQVGNQAGHPVGHQTGYQAGNQTGNQAGNQVGNQAGNQVSNQAGNQAGNQVGADAVGPASSGEALAHLFAALGDPTRLVLVSELSTGGAFSIAHLTGRTALSRQGVTKHLSVLAEAGVVRDVKVGRERLWQLEPARINEARQALESIGREWDQALARIKRFIEKDD